MRGKKIELDEKSHYGGIGNKVYFRNSLKLFITIDIQIDTPSLWEDSYSEYQEFFIHSFRLTRNHHQDKKGS